MAEESLDARATRWCRTSAASPDQALAQLGCLLDAITARLFDISQLSGIAFRPRKYREVAEQAEGAGDAAIRGEETSGRAGVPTKLT